MPIVLVLAALLVLAAFVRLTLFTGFIGSDDSSYLASALDLIDGRWTGADHFASRLGFVAPVAGIVWLLGTSEFATVTLPLLVSLLVLVVVWRLGEIYFDRPSAILAVLLLTFSANNVVISSMLVPDTLMSLLMAASALAWEEAGRRRPAHRLMGMILAGVFLGLAYLVKEPGALLGCAFVLVAGLAVLRTGRFDPAWGGFAAGVVVVLLVLEPLAQFVLSGSYHARTGLVSRAVAHEFADPGHAQSYVWSEYLRSMFVSVYQSGVLYYLLAGALVVAALARRPLPLLPIAWIGILLGYLSIGSASFSSYVPLPKQPRYLESIAVPTVLLASGMLRDLWRSPRVLARAGVVAAVGAHMVVGVLCAQFATSALRWDFEPARATYQLLVDRDLVPLWAQHRLANGLYQLSRTRWRVAHWRQASCVAGDPEAVMVLSVPASVSVSAPSRAAPPCDEWRQLQTVELRPPSNAIFDLARVVALNPYLPASVTSRFRHTLETKIQARRTVHVFVPDPPVRLAR